MFSITFFLRRFEESLHKDMAEKISILMATYNGGKYIEEQVESIQKQTYSNWSLLVRDDGSTDDTLDKLRELASSDHRIDVISDDKGNLGVNDNFRELLKLADGKYIAFSDQDDVWLPSKLEVCLNEIKRIESAVDSQPVLVHTDVSIVDSDLNIVKHSFIARRAKKKGLRSLIFANSVQGSATLINNILKVKMLSLDCHLNHDHHAALIAELQGTRSFIPSSLMYYRQHENNVIGAGVSNHVDDSNKHKKNNILRTALDKFDCPSKTFNFSMEFANSKSLKDLLDHFEGAIKPESMQTLYDWHYIINGSSKFKKIWLAIKNRYGFSCRKDTLCFFHYILTEK